MEKNRSIEGAAQAIDRTKNAGTQIADEMADGARRAYEDTKEVLQHGVSDASDFVGEAYRAGEAHVRRRPLESLLAVAALAFLVGWAARR